MFALGGATIFTFFIRFLFFLSLWVGLILSPELLELNELSALLLFCAGSIIVYFLVPISKKSYLHFILMLILVYSANIFVDKMGLTYIGLLQLYIMVEAALVVRDRKYYFILCSYFILSVHSLQLHNSLKFEYILLICLLCSLLYLLWKKIEEREELFLLYNEMILEYRQLKRKAFENEEMVRLEERTRISREIHDSVGHTLTAVLMQLEMLSMESSDTRIDTIKKDVRNSLEEIRLAVRTLKQDEAVGVSSVLQLIRKLEVESHISIHLTTKHGVLSTKLSNEQSIVLYRSLQEALTNAMRYGASREIFVVFGRNAVGDFHLVVKNRIKGARVFNHGFGLENMKKRLEEIGGTMNAYQTEEQFIVDATFPVKGEEI